VLVVDDSRLQDTLAAADLLAEGYAVTLAADGAGAIAHFSRQRPDLVLLDIPDGFEACRRLRELDPDAEVPILVLTAPGERDLQRRAFASGADDLLTRPIQKVELLLRVRSLLRAGRIQRKRNAVVSAHRDALLRALEDKRRLTATIVHDLKSPLAGVLGNAHYVLDEAGLDGPLRESLTDIITLGETMHGMVLDILDVSGSESGALTPRRSAVDVAAVLEQCRSAFRGRVRQSGHQLVVALRAPLRLAADSDLLRRVLENLLDNATKYAPPGTPIQIDVRQDDHRVLFQVRDKGPGVPAPYRTRIFEPYAQLDRDRAVHRRGSRGLGLAFCRIAVEAHPRCQHSCRFT